MIPRRDCHHRILIQTSLIVSALLMGSGCVSTDTHQKALEELEKSKKLSASQAAELDALKKKAKADSDQLQQQLAGLQHNLDEQTMPAKERGAASGFSREGTRSLDRPFSGTPKQAGRPRA